MTLTTKSNVRRISKREAFTRFSVGQPVIFCPCKMLPCGPWSLGCVITSKEWLEKAESYGPGHELWKGTKEKTAWDLAYNNWAFYNTNSELGYYAHFYRQS